MTLCECGCGGEAEPGRRYIQGHNRKGKSSTCKGKPRPEEVVQRIKETRRINKEVKEGKRLPPEPPELPFCACGCGGRVTKLKNKYIAGHQNRGRTPWSKGKTKESDERLVKAAENLSKAKIKTYQSEEGDILKKKISKSKSGVPLSKDHRDSIGRGLTIFYQSEEGEIFKKILSMMFSGEGGPFYGKKHTEKTIQKNREHRMHQKFPRHHTKPELRCEEYSIKNSIPATYTGGGSFWIPIFIWESDIMKPDGEKFFLSELKKAGAF